MRVEIPVSITSTVINGVPVFVTEGPRCTDSEWLIFRSSAASQAIPSGEESAESRVGAERWIQSALKFVE